MTATQFRPIFRRVCDHFGIVGAERAATWRLCLTDRSHIAPRVVACYRAIASSLLPIDRA